MKIKLLKDLDLKTTGGRVFHHKAGDRLSVLDITGKSLIARGDAMQIPSPPIRFYSKLLKEMIWLTNSSIQSEELVKQGVEEVVYTALEYYHLIRLPKRTALKIHEVKKTFQGSIILQSGAVFGAFSEDESKKEGGDDMKKHEAFPSTYLTKEDLPQPKTWTIQSVEMEDLEFEQEKTSKPILHFMEQDSKPFVLNVTNWETIEEFYGEESDLWTGKKIELFRDNSIMFGKKKVGGIRVRKPTNMLFDTPFREVLSSPDEAPF